MKKTLFTLNINNYEPEITGLTFPLMKMYADKIGADFHVITERKFEGFAGLEKFQIYQLGKEMKNDWNIFIDPDCLVHPDFFDVTACLPKDTTCAYSSSDFSPIRFKPDAYFLRDGRMFGKGNWFGIASDWCLDYFHPLDDITVEEAMSQCFPTHEELNCSKPMSPYNMVEDFIVSRNIARYGLKHCLVTDVMAKYGKNLNYIPAGTVMTPQGPVMQTGGPLFHVYQQDADQKLVMMRNQLAAWRINIQKVVVPGEVKK